MTQEFHISITPIRDDEYLVRTEQVAPGVPLAEEQVIWPMDEWLRQARQLMNDPLVGLLQGQGTLSPSEMDSSVTSLMELGQNLYHHLFQGILRDSWTTAQGIAHHRGEVLRLRLGLKGPNLPKLPWEVMHSHGRDGLGLVTHPLATGVNLLFSRYQPDRHTLRSGMAIAPITSSVLRILMVIALPADQDELDLDQEARHLQQELRLQPGHLQGNLVGTLPDIQVSILKHPSRAQLAQALEQSQYQVLHYAGHSDLGTDGGKLYLVDQNGLTETLTGDDLAGLLVNNGIQMAVFNSCRGGHTATVSESSPQSQRTLTDALVSRGVPSVLAMAERIPDDVALTLTRLFYRNLKQGYPVDLSLSRARQGLLAAYGSHQLYWALPTLYLHPDFDGYLTAGDRILDNPADSLARAPYLHTPSLIDTAHISSSEPLLYGEQDVATHPLADVAAFQEAPTDVMSSANSATNQGMDDDFSQHDPYYNDFEDAPAFSTTDHDQYLGSVDHQMTSLVDDSLESVHETTADSAYLMSPTELAELTGEPIGEETAIVDQSVIIDDDTIQESSQGSPSSFQQERPALENRQSGVTGFHPGTVEDGEQEQSLYSEQPQHIPRLEPSRGRAQEDVSYRSPSAIVPRSDAPPPPPGHLQPVGPASRTRDSRRSRSRSRRPGWVYPLAGVAALAIAVVGYRASIEFIEPTQTPTEIAQTRELADAAEVKLSEGRLDEARELLDQVPKEDIGEPQIAFLQGRLIWELLKKRDTEFSVEDARRSWEHAAYSVDNAHYYNALGFALYAENRMNDAIEVWGESLTLLEKTGVVVVPESNGEGAGSANNGDVEQSVSVPTETISDSDALTAYAGIALALAQLAGERPTFDQSVDLMSKVVKIQQVIRNSDPSMFDPDNLRNNWLWTDSTIVEWELLSQIQSQ